LENALGILEKEREIEIFALHSFRPEGLLLPLLRIWPTRPQQPACQLLSREPQRVGPAEAAGRLALAAAPFFLLMSLTPRAPASSHCHTGPAQQRRQLPLARNRAGLHLGRVRLRPNALALIHKFMLSHK
jgi:hypothetical protein